MQKTHRKSCLYAIILLAAFAGSSFAVTRRVNVNVPPGGDDDGSSWANAYTNLYDALGDASSGDEIWVARGTYYPTASTTDRTATFQMIDGVPLYGGFVGSETAVGQRDVDANVTVLSGDIDGDNVPNEGNVYHVVTASSGCVIDGFHIVMGYADSTVIPDYVGGGLVIDRIGQSASPTILNCTFANNVATSFGGAIGSLNSAFTLIEDCTFASNRVVDSASDGGAIYSTAISTTYSTGTIRRCSFIDNRQLQDDAASDGGAMFCANAVYSFEDCDFIGNSAGYGGALSLSLTGYSKYNLSDCVFIGNGSLYASANARGGAVHAIGTDADGSLFMTNCIFAANYQQGLGGAVSFYNAQLSNFGLTGCQFIGNDVQTKGGGLHTFDAGCSGSGVAVKNCSFIGNRRHGATTASAGGGGLYNWNAATTIQNSTFAKNVATVTHASITTGGEGGGIWQTETAVTLDNTIVWTNEAQNATYAQLEGTINATYSDIQQGTVYSGTGNDNSDPAFEGGPSGTWTTTERYNAYEGKTVLTDSTADWDVNEHAGKIVQPNTSHPLHFYIVSNTRDSLTVYGNARTEFRGGPIAGVGDAYEITDYQLTSGSPCEDTGTNNGLADDIEGTSRPQGSGYDMGAYEFLDDSSAPADVSSVTVTERNTRLDLAWTNPGDSDFAGVIVVRKAGSATTGTPADGTTYSVGDTIGGDDVVYRGTDGEFEDDSLSNGTTYYYTLWAYDSGPFYNYSTGVETNGTPISDTTAPSSVSGATATPGVQQIQLNWTNPGDADFEGVVILRRIGASPSASPENQSSYEAGDMIGNGTVVYVGGAETWTDTSLADGTAYYYELFAYDVALNYASSDSANATTTADTTPPSAVVAQADSAVGAVDLTWWNPTDSDFEGVLVLRKAGSAPTGAPTDGTTYTAGQTIGDGTVAAVRAGTAGLMDEWTDTGLSNGTTYHYKLFAYDEQPNYASAASASATPAMSSDVIFVDGGGAAGAGTSWADAYNNLATALTAATAGKQIWVKTGTYNGTPYTMKDGVDMYGGFAGTEGSTYVRDIASNPTVLDGENLRQVILGATAVFDGFEVRRGYLTSTTIAGGAGMRNHNASPTVLNCTFADNMALSSAAGGAMMNWNNSAPVISNCVFEGNAAYIGGGAIYNQRTSAGSASPIIRNCYFITNSTASSALLSASFGGAIFNENQWDLLVEDSTFIGNVARGGYVMYNTETANATVRRCTFVDNRSQDNSGGTFNLANTTSVTIEDSLFSGNRGNQYGGIIYSKQTAANPNPIILRRSTFVGSESDMAGAVYCDNAYTYLIAENCLFAGNRANSYAGGAILGDTGASMTIRHSTFAGNYATKSGATAIGGGGAIATISDGGPITVVNSIIWSNMSDNAATEEFDDDAGTIAISHSIVRGGYSGDGNLNQDPEYAGVVASGTWTAIGTYDGGAGQVQLTDGNASYATDELAGLVLLPDTGQPLQFLVASNTANTIFVWGNALADWDGNAIAEFGDAYEVYDYTPIQDSPAVDSVSSVGVTTDIVGNSRPLGNDYDMGAYEVDVDFTAPANVSGLTATPASEKIQLDWTNPSDTDYTGVLITRVDGSTPPANQPTDRTGYTVGGTIGGDEIVYIGPASDATPDNPAYQVDESLVNGNTYSYRVFAYDAVSNYALGLTVTETPANDQTPPLPITGLSATPGLAEIVLDWTNPSTADFNGVLITRALGGTAPAKEPVQQQVYLEGEYVDSTDLVVYAGTGADGTPGNANIWTNTALMDHQEYSYSFFAYDASRNYTNAVSASATTYDDVTPPDDVSGLFTIPEDTQVTVGWTNPPAADFEGVLIVRRLGGAPTGTPVDTNTYTVGESLGNGEVVYVGIGTDGTPGQDSLWVDNDVVNYNTYYYNVFAYDEAPNYSSGASDNAMPEILNVIYVDKDAVYGADDGTSWADAYVDLQDALGAATSGDRIMVAEGTYYPTNGTDRTATFQMVAGVTLYGGCAGNEISATDRNWTNTPTILSGDIDRNGAMDPGNVYHVLKGANGTLDGFTVTMGYADGTGDNDDGAGLYNNGSSATPTVRNSTFTKNYISAGYGGGIYNLNNGTFLIEDCTFTDNHGFNGVAIANYGSAVDGTIRRCVFYKNTAEITQGKGTVYVYLSPVTIQDCRFFGNVADYGAAISVYEASPKIRDCVFAANRSLTGSYGSGSIMFDGVAATPIYALVSNCVFSANSSERAGGAIFFLEYAGGIVDRCQFVGNEADSNAGKGGAIYCFNSRSQTVNVRNSTFVGNRQWVGTGHGGAIYSGGPGDYQSTVLKSCTFAANRCVGSGAFDGGGAVYAGDTNTTATGCIFWDNVSENGQGNQIWEEDGDNLVITYCDIQGGHAGAGNIDSDPLFVGGSTGVWTQVGGYDDTTGQTTLTDADADWDVDAEAGKYLWANTNLSYRYYIASNTKTTVTVWGDATQNRKGVPVANVGKSYKIEDYQLTSGSPCENTGTDTGVGHDIELTARPQGAGHDIGAYEFAADATPPSDITDLAAAAYHARIEFTWTNPTDTDFAAVLIARTENASPSGSPSDGTFYGENDTFGDWTVVHRTSGTTWTNTGLVNGTTYYYKFYAYDNGPGYNYASGVATDETPVEDVTAPANVTSLTATPGVAQVALGWTNPADGDFAGVVILRKVGSAPTGTPSDLSFYNAGDTVGDATVAYAGTGTSGTPGAASGWTDTELADGAAYYYVVYARDSAPNYPSGASANATTTTDSTAPSAVTDVALTAGDGELAITWKNPSAADFEGVLAVRKAGSAPTGTPTTGYDYIAGDTIGDGTVVYVGAGTSGTPGDPSGFTDTGLVNGTTYYYRFFAYDERPNFAAAASGNGTPALGSDIIYVDKDVASSGDGTSWAQAKETVTEALAIAVSGKDIWVADGTYAEAATLAMVAGVDLYGGFAGTETSRGDRDWENNLTLLSGGGTQRVITGANNARLDGFVITNGVTPAAAGNHGGGMYNANVSPTVANCTFTDNTTSHSLSYGGAMANYGNLVAPVISNCVFRNNTTFSGSSGAAIYNRAVSTTLLAPKILDCTFVQNTASSEGGAIYNINNMSPLISNCTFIANQALRASAIGNSTISSPTIANCTFAGNKTTTSGASIFNTASASPTISDCVFSGNRSDGVSYGGGAAIRNSDGANLSMFVQRCVFAGNESAAHGGAILNSNNGLQYNNNPVIQCSVFAGNVSEVAGGAIYAASSGNIRHSTFIHNRANGTSASHGGGALDCSVDTIPAGGVLNRMTDCIVWSNSAFTAGDEILGTDVDATYNIVRGGYTGTGNLDSDPLFEGGPSGTWTGVGTYDPPVGQTVLSDSSANWAVNEHAGKILRPDTGLALCFAIASNTKDTVTVWGDATQSRLGTTIAEFGDAYAILDLQLTASSPAVDAGVDAGVADDIEGTARPAGSGFDMGAFEYSPDTTAPGPVTRLTATPQTARIEFTWTNPSDADFAGVIAVRKTGSAPTGTPSDGTEYDVTDTIGDGTVVYKGSANAWTNTGLANGTTYHYKFYAYDYSPAFNYSTAASASGQPAADSTPPANVGSLTATAGEAQIRLNWNNPSASDFAGVLILRKTDSAPTFVPVNTTTYSQDQDLGDGQTVAYVGTAFSGTPSAANVWTNLSLADGTHYYYKVHAYDGSPNYSVGGAQANATTDTDVTAPAAVTRFTVEAGDGLNSLSWTNPVAADFTGVLILRKTGSDVTGTPVNTTTYNVNDVIDDATVVYKGVGTDGDPGDYSEWLDTGRVNGTEYFYALFAYDERPNYSTAVTGSGTPATPATIVYVNHEIGASGNGESWATAKKTIIEAMAKAGAEAQFDTIWVAEGLYDQEDATIVMSNNVAMYGGFTNDMDSLSQRDWETYPTIIDGEGTHRVLKGANNAVLDGFIVTNGLAPNVAGEYGGGLYCYNTSPTVQNCTFANNQTTHSLAQGGAIGIYGHPAGPTISNCVFTANYAAAGGAMTIYKVSVGSTAETTLKNCTFVRNSAAGYGGALYMWNVVDPTIEDCTFANNTSPFSAGMAIADYGTPTVTRCTFAGNTASTSYGGVSVGNVTAPAFSQCIFSGNRAAVRAGGLHLEGNTVSGTTIDRCYFAGNESGDWGGALYLRNQAASTTPKLRNCLVVGNTAGTGGGGLYNSANTEVRHCTFVGNRASGTTSVQGGGSVFTELGTALIRNTILWDNQGANGSNEINKVSGTLTVSYSDVEGGYTGTANWNTDPVFRTADEGTWTAVAGFDPNTGKTTFTDSTAVWAPDSHIGKTLQPNTNQLLQFYVIDNDATSITVWGNAVTNRTGTTIAAVGSPYKINDYRLRVNSPLLDEAAVGLTVDIVGTVRPQGSANDIGAYEITPDGTPPSAVSGLSAVAGQAEVVLSWTNPSDTDFEGVLIVRKVGSTPTWSPTDTNVYTLGQTVGDGTVAYVGGGSDADPGDANGFTDTDLEDLTHYYYKVFAYDGAPNYATPAADDDTTEADVTAPGAVTGLGSAPGDSKVVLDWTNPSQVDFAGVLIVRKSGSAPTFTPTDTSTYSLGQDLGDGQTVAYVGAGADGDPGAANIWTNTGLVNFTHYYYSVFAYDEIPNYSGSAAADETPAPQGVIYVAWNASGDNNGTSWTHAYTTLTQALFAASSGGQIWVAEGTYKPGTARTHTFTLKNGVSVYGGFTTTMISFSERDPDTYTTILSGDIDNDGILNSGNVYHVVTGADEAILDGFTVTMGYADTGTGVTGTGGGLYMNTADNRIEVRNCRFTSNAAYYRGGAMYLYWTAHTDETNVIENCTIDNNYVWYVNGHAGGIFAWSRRSIVVTNCTFADNVSSNGFAGAWYSEYTHPKFRNCTFARNRAGLNSTGAIYAMHDNIAPVSALEISDCVFYANQGQQHAGACYLTGGYNTIDVIQRSEFYDNRAVGNEGGALYLYSFDGRIEDCVFSGNRSTGGNYGGAIYADQSDTRISRVFVVGGSTLHSGGGLYFGSTSSPVLQNVLLAGNRTKYRGGGVWLSPSGVANKSTVVNCTIVSNKTTEAGYGGGGLYLYNGQVNVTNSILYGNVSPASGHQVWIDYTTDVGNFGYSCIQDEVAGIYKVAGATANDNGNNQDVDPMFVGGDAGTWSANAVYDSSLGITVLTNSAASWTEDALVGKLINPDTAADNLMYYIAANGTKSITIWGNASGATSGEAYLIEDFDLGEDSDLIDGGTNPGAPSTDILGRSRPSGPTVDIGAYESLSGGNYGTTFMIQ